MSHAARRVSPAFERNKVPILEALRKHLPQQGQLRLLEIASGPGEHAAHWAAELGAGCAVQPTECDEGALDSIRSYCERLPNVAPPLVLNAASEAWPAPVEAAAWDCVVAVNLCHIAPFEATRGLVLGAARVLRPGGVLCVCAPLGSACQLLAGCRA